MAVDREEGGLVLYFFLLLLRDGLGSSRYVYLGLDGIVVSWIDRCHHQFLHSSE